MISYEDALRIIRETAGQKRLSAETVGVEEITGRICAQDISAPVANQPFDNSAMDGFALRIEDLARAANGNPVALDMIGHIAAGDPSSFGAPAHGQCYEIMTGALLPPGCDAVVPVEQTEKGAGRKIMFRAAPGCGDNIRRAGADFSVGDAVVGKGAVLETGHILALATLGVGKVSVLKRPRVALISTGREVVDDPGAKLGPGQIYNSTRPYLHAALSGLNAEVKCCGTVPDDPQAFKDKLSCMLKNGVDVGVSTGAVSAGVHDFIPSVLKDMGAEILFHKVAIRPGKPLIFAKFPGNGPLFVGLPGNPVSSAAGLRFFVQPLLRALQGLPPEEPQYALLKGSYVKGKTGLRFFVRGRLRHTGKTTHEIEIPEGQQSFKVRPFVDTGVWVSVPEDVESLKAGDVVAVFQ